MKLTGIVLFWFLLTFSSCSKTPVNTTDNDLYLSDIPPNNIELKEETLTPADYMSWINDPTHNLKRSKKISEFDFTLFSKPVDYLISLDQKTETIDRNKYSELKKEFGNLLYFDFKIEVHDIPTELLKYKVSGEAEYQRRVTYFAYEMQKDFFLVDHFDTIPCVMFHYERTYDIVPYVKVLLGFNPLKNNTENTFEFIYQDRVFNNGPIKFTIRKTDLENIPKLKTV
ncbi:MAG: hypothetical protein HY062_01595 [Bacteroidetes bacterium]|nr:hypothetical protein [Bacteroidota bacterium]